MGKYQAYSEYKETNVFWLGSVPKHWVLSKLKFVKDIIPNAFVDGPFGSNLKSSHIVEGGDVYVIESNFATQGILNENKLKTITQEHFETICRSEAREGDIIIAKIGAQYGKASILPSICKRAVVSGNSLKLSINEVIFSKLFAHYVFIFLKESGAFDDIVNATAQPALSLGDLNNIPIPFPSLNEQQQIANFLDHETAKIDTLIEKQQQLIALLKEKRQAVISHAVTKGLNASAPMRDSGVEWLGEVPEHWVSCALKYYARIVDCKHITAEFFDEGIPLASIGEVKEWHVNLATAKLTNEKYYLDLIGGGRKPEAGDIIYSRNATVGEAALVVKDMPDFAMGQDVCLIRLDEGVLPEYILYVLKSGVISNQLDLAMVGSTFKRINVDDIRNFVIALPSYEEQIDIVAELTRILGKYDALVINAESTVELLAERRTALISAAVTGKIDVRNWQAPEANHTSRKGISV